MKTKILHITKLTAFILGALLLATDTEDIVAFTIIKLIALALLIFAGYEKPKKPETERVSPVIGMRT